MKENVLRDFALNSEAASVLASLQDNLLNEDIRDTKSTSWFGDNTEELRKKKENWYAQWHGLVWNGFQSSDAAEKPTIWYQNHPEFTSALRRIRESSDRLPAGLILLELASFSAYWPMNPEQATEYKGLVFETETHKNFLAWASKELGFSESRASQLRDQLEVAQKSIGGYYLKVAFGLLAGLGLGALTMGLAAPFIAGAIGAAMGLSGAAAVSAGFAVLGGGAIAAGGFGMTGGMVVIVGGGAILGVGAGAGGGTLVAQMTASEALLSAAKLEVMLKEFVLQGQRDMAKIQQILTAQRRSIQALEMECDRLRLAGKKNEKRIDELEHAIKLLNESLKRNQGMAAQ